MTDEQVQLLIKAGLTTMLGAILQWCVKEFIGWRTDNGKPPSPRTKMFIAFGFDIAVPTVLYLLYTFGVHAEVYSLTQNLGYILGAFTAQQGTYGMTRLPTGADLAATAKPKGPDWTYTITPPTRQPIAPAESRNLTGENARVPGTPGVVDEEHGGQP